MSKFALSAEDITVSVDGATASETVTCSSSDAAGTLKQEARFMSGELVTSSSAEEHIAKLKAEIRRLQLIVRSMSTVDISRTSGPQRLATTAKQSSDGFLFDSFEGSNDEDHAALLEENAKLQEENENLRAEMEALKELCEAKGTGVESLSAEEMGRIEKNVSLKLIENIGSAFSLLLQQERNKIEAVGGIETRSAEPVE